MIDDDPGFREYAETCGFLHVHPGLFWIVFWQQLPIREAQQEVPVALVDAINLLRSWARDPIKRAGQRFDALVGFFAPFWGVEGFELRLGFVEPFAQVVDGFARLLELGFFFFELRFDCF